MARLEDAESRLVWERQDSALRQKSWEAKMEELRKERDDLVLSVEKRDEQLFELRRSASDNLDSGLV